MILAGLATATSSAIGGDFNTGSATVLLTVSTGATSALLGDVATASAFVATSLGALAPNSAFSSSAFSAAGKITGTNGALIGIDVAAAESTTGAVGAVANGAIAAREGSFGIHPGEVGRPSEFGPTINVAGGTFATLDGENTRPCCASTDAYGTSGVGTISIARALAAESDPIGVIAPNIDAEEAEFATGDVETTGDVGLV